MSTSCGRFCTVHTGRLHFGPTVGSVATLAQACPKSQSRSHGCWRVWPHIFTLKAESRIPRSTAACTSLWCSWTNPKVWPSNQSCPGKAHHLPQAPGGWAGCPPSHLASLTSKLSWLARAQTKQQPKNSKMLPKSWFLMQKDTKTANLNQVFWYKQGIHKSVKRHLFVAKKRKKAFHQMTFLHHHEQSTEKMAQGEWAKTFKSRGA